MSWRNINLLIILAVICAMPTGIHAQVPGQPPAFTPRSRPTTSPYLLLSRSGNRALNYFQIIKPQRELQQANQQQASRIGNLQQQIDAQNQILVDPNSQLGQTGHRSYFQNYGGYFSFSRTGSAARSFGQSVRR